MRACAGQHHRHNRREATDALQFVDFVQANWPGVVPRLGTCTRSPVARERAGRHRHAARQRHRFERRGRPRRDRHRHAKRRPTSAGRAVTNEAGYYTFSSLKNGTYAVEAELQGFKKVVRAERQASTSTRTIRVDLKLEVGAADRDGHGRGRDAAAADRPHRHRPHHRVEDGRRAAARPSTATSRRCSSRCPARRGRTASTRSSSTRRTRCASKSTASRAWPTTR